MSLFPRMSPQRARVHRLFADGLGGGGVGQFVHSPAVVHALFGVQRPGLLQLPHNRKSPELITLLGNTSKIAAFSGEQDVLSRGSELARLAIRLIDDRTPTREELLTRADRFSNDPAVENATREKWASLFFRAANGKVPAAPIADSLPWERPAKPVAGRTNRARNHDGTSEPERGRLRQGIQTAGGRPRPDNPPFRLNCELRNVDLYRHSRATGRRQFRVGRTPLIRLKPGTTALLEHGRPHKGIDEVAVWQAVKRVSLTAESGNLLSRATLSSCGVSGVPLGKSIVADAVPHWRRVNGQFDCSRWYDACCVPGGSTPIGRFVSRVRCGPLDRQRRQAGGLQIVSPAICLTRDGRRKLFAAPAPPGEV